MHYKNGREAKNGDRVIMFSGGKVISGFLYDAVAGNDHCNGRIAPVNPNNDHYANLSECLHADDVNAALAGTVPDTSKPTQSYPDSVP